MERIFAFSPALSRPLLFRTKIQILSANFQRTSFHSGRRQGFEGETAPGGLHKTRRSKRADLCSFLRWEVKLPPFWRAPCNSTPIAPRLCPSAGPSSGSRRSCAPQKHAFAVLFPAHGLFPTPNIGSLSKDLCPHLCAHTHDALKTYKCVRARPPHPFPYTGLRGGVLDANFGSFRRDVDGDVPAAVLRQRVVLRG